MSGPRMVVMLAAIAVGIYGCDASTSSYVQNIRYVDITTRRPEATVHDVAAVLDALLDGKAPGRSLKPASQPAFGCYIRDLG